MTGEVSQAVNEHLIKENARLTTEVKELRDTVMFAREQWKLMQSIVERLDRMDRRLDRVLSDYDGGYVRSATKYSANTNPSF